MKFAYKIPHLSYLFIVAALLAILSLPQSFTTSLRGNTISSFSSLWSFLEDTKGSAALSESTLDVALLQELEYLRRENTYLTTKIQQFQDFYHYDTFLERKLDELAFLDAHDAAELRDVVQHHYQETCNLLKVHMYALPANVIFRDNAFWNNSLWVDVGYDDNIHLDRPVVEKNSPVVVGDAVVGVIDYVGRRQSRVKLITDSGLTPSVRVSRGLQQDLTLQRHIEAVVEAMATYDDIAVSEEFIQGLQNFKAGVISSVREYRLAKGELRGSVQSLKRSQDLMLRGVGFNYDYADEYGPARELRSGVPLSDDDTVPTLPLIQDNDLLVTTGMDGVFPEGLHVATITKVYPLEEGNYTYDIEARPVIEDFNGLSTLFILPPQGYDPLDQPKSL
jgi:rod shape-determining protein MreC